MAQFDQHYQGHLPPFRPSPETVSNIMTVQFVAIILLLAVVGFNMGSRAVWLIAISGLTGLFAQVTLFGISGKKSFGSNAHSALTGMLVAFMLPANTDFHIAIFGTLAAVFFGKHLFGGMGNYFLHPALLGRALIQLIFHEQLPTVNASLRNITATSMQNIDLADNLRHLDDLSNYMLGLCDGYLCQSASLFFMAIGLYFVYRGYINLRFVIVFILTTIALAIFCPIKVIDFQGQAIGSISIFSLAPSFNILFAYVGYQIFAGAIIFTAFILNTDMTVSPITNRGQYLFAIVVAVLAITLRFYTPILLPAPTALLIATALTPTIDKLTRPK